MFYIMYLTSLCTRRSWPTPQFSSFRTRTGYGCVVRVNNREYTTGDVSYATEELARNAAATQAYMICRNFSVNDGMLPGQRPGMAAAGNAGGTQGLPVAIGTGRHRRATGGVEEGASSGSSAGGGWRRGVEEGVRGMGAGLGHRGGAERRGSAVCPCRRAQVAGYGRCLYCLREAGYA
ncbi:hypothetical protein BDZ85DRAFT_309016 [Elsinoe ampelina]|uniref:DRBM domain-containing protein n=1 Tax=Elsinoe ampelina TaxID=302913 RepID=A0A6A6GGT0_9PEZI|nr:hypothetical protein BDZ85DRAFT_309016 [Elsinoe ampelina]